MSLAVAWSAAMPPIALAAGGETCADATVIQSIPPGGFVNSGDTTGAADDTRITECTGFLSMAGPDHVYQFHVFPGNNLTFTVSTGDPEYDPSIYIRTSCSVTFGTCVASRDTGKFGEPETLSVAGLATGTYYFYIDSIYTADKEGPGDGPYTLTVTGSLGTPNNASFFTVPPCRVLDTREADGPVLSSSGPPRTFQIAGRCEIPVSAKSISANVAVIGPTAQGYVTVFPAGSPLPLASTINYRANQIRANNAILPLGAGGALSVVAGQPPGNTVHFILDVNGYFQ